MSQDKTTTVQSNTDILNEISENSSKIELFFKGKEYAYTRTELPILIGRDPETCEIVTMLSTASRQHCSLEVRDNQIGIRDTSTNGTYIKIGRAETVLIKNSFYPLVSQGHIGMGESLKLESPELIHFRLTSDKTKK